MPYIIRQNKSNLLLLNNSAKNGLYWQTLSVNGLSRPNIISRIPTSRYSACIDSNHSLHIIFQPTNNQVTHINYKDKHIYRNTILEDPKSIYNFSNIKCLYSKNNIHLFYTASKPTGDSWELIHHILYKKREFETLPIISFDSKPFGFRYYTYNDKIILLYGETNKDYLIKLKVYQDNKWSKSSLLIQTSFPIGDFQFCVDTKGYIHIVYTLEKYGRYHLLYKKYYKEPIGDDNMLFNASSPISPCIFIYHNALWINFIADNELQMMLSMDMGNSFSKNVPCSSSSSELKLCNFIMAPDIALDNFNCNTIFASLSSSIRAGIISKIDMTGFHPDIKPNTELELFIDGNCHHTSNYVSSNVTEQYNNAGISKLKAENLELKQVQENLIIQYNDMAELTKKIQAEGKKWRDKALELTNKLENFQINNPQTLKTSTKNKTQDL